MSIKVLYRREGDLISTSVSVTHEESQLITSIFNNLLVRGIAPRVIRKDTELEVVSIHADLTESLKEWEMGYLAEKIVHETKVKALNIILTSVDGHYLMGCRRDLSCLKD